MCGIAGAIGQVDPDLIDAVGRMSCAQKHRGPDDEGSWTNFDATADRFSAAFGFRRLAIIDLSPKAHQPMIDAATGNVLIFNGELYNFRELRRTLEREGTTFHSSSDSEVLLKAYGRWGTDAITRMRGMFAFAIWDQSRRRVVLARDRLGIKPLYFCRLERHGKPAFLFASELRSSLASEMVSRKLSRAALSTYMWNGFVVGSQTIVEGVRLLDAGTFAVIDERGCACTRYWQLPAADDRDDAIEQLREQLATAVKQHLVSDVPLGVFLSGGIDSSAVTALAARQAGADVRTFNIGFDEAQFDESRFARSVSEKLGTRHTEVRLNQSTFKSRLSDALASIDQPTFDAINTFFVSRAVREAGMTVALAGTGGDELFGGYRSFVDIPKAARLARATSSLPRPLMRTVAAGVTRIKTGRFGDVPPQTRWGKLGDALATNGHLVGLYQSAYALFTTDFISQLIDGGLDSTTRHGLPIDVLDDLAAISGQDGALHGISMLELSNFIGQRLLRDTDAASMAVSLEVRVPFLDHEVVQAVAAIPARKRFHPLGKKQLLRTLAMAELDPMLFDRPKAGFVLPIDVWCREQLQDEVGQVLHDESLCSAAGLNHDAVGNLWRAFQSRAPGIYWSRIWSVFVLLWWCKTHRVSI